MTAYERKLAYGREWRRKNTEKNRAIQRAYYYTNREKMIEKCKRYFASHPGYQKATFKKYYDNNRDKIRSRKLHYGRKLRETDPLHRLEANLRARIYQALKSTKRHSCRTMKWTGCTIEFLKGWLESRWQPGMSWDNYNQHGWHVDHIIPCSVFDLTDPEKARQCFHYTNLQPLWAKDNLRKANFVGEPVRNWNKTSEDGENVATPESTLNAKN